MTAQNITAKPTAGDDLIALAHKVAGPVTSDRQFDSTQGMYVAAQDLLAEVINCRNVAVLETLRDLLGEALPLRRQETRRLRKVGDAVAIGQNDPIDIKARMSGAIGVAMNQAVQVVEINIATLNPPAKRPGEKATGA
jgi:hypothetical protein